MARLSLISSVLLVSTLVVSGPARAALVTVTSQGSSEAELAQTYSTTDLLNGLIPIELPGDRGWHPVNPAATNSLDPNGLPAFTDGVGPVSGLTGLLNDFPGPGTPAKRIQYTFATPMDVSEVRVFSGNEGRDGRVFHTYTLELSTDGAATWGVPIYVQSHASGTVNTAQWRNVLTQLSDSSGVLSSGVTDLRMQFYAADNTAGQIRDPFDGLNPFTGIDDGLGAPIASPLIWEIDVLGRDGGVIPEPSSVLLLGAGLGALLPFVRRRR